MNCMIIGIIILLKDLQEIRIQNKKGKMIIIRGVKIKMTIRKKIIKCCK